MNKILFKICKIHGELKHNDIYLSPRYKINNLGEKVDASYPVCKLCRVITNALFMKSDKRKEYDKQWKKMNAIKNREYIDKSLIKNREENLLRKRLYNKTDKARKWKKDCIKKNVTELRNEYVKKLLLKNSNLSRGDITMELIEAKRALIKLKRLLKEKQKI